MGGIALGNGVTSSGLMDAMDGVIHRMLEGRTLYSVVIVLSVILLVCPSLVSLIPFTCHIVCRLLTFISHTIASILLVPIAQLEAGRGLPGVHANLLVFLMGLMYSTGWVCRFLMPRTNSRALSSKACWFLVLMWHACWIARVAHEVNLGKVYLTNLNFLKNGIPVSIIAALVRVVVRAVC